MGWSEDQHNETMQILRDIADEKGAARPMPKEKKPDLRIDIIGMQRAISDALAAEGLRNDRDLVERLTSRIVEAIYPNAKIVK